ncbi:cadherin repeat domain-containing protein [Bradyrhizobium vignae]|uniref:Cadherin domain-containing protein n=1 Tax=Bradyrhizobium vignae TaxID=1549949 RepID=A0A2U3PXN9_9BRAD|nr:cadherin repeat domain-containing protein [Bradyrhizobium vignae]SPP93914.1 protein of unknown function [Bradyrhizobium vignae]
MSHLFNITNVLDRRKFVERCVKRLALMLLISTSMSPKAIAIFGGVRSRTGAPGVPNLSLNLQIPTAAGAIVGTFAHLGGTRTTCSIVSDDSGGCFGTNENGVITVTSSGALLLAERTYNVTMRVRNSYGYDDLQISIIVSSASAGVPVVTSQSFTFGVPGEANQTIGMVGATNDPNSFSIVSGNSSGLFAIDSAGRLTANANMNRISALSTGLRPQNYSLIVRATNEAGYGEGTVTVNCQQLPWPDVSNRPSMIGDTLTWTGPANGGPSCWNDVQTSHALSVSNITQSSADDQVIEYLDITGDFRFSHRNVTLRRCRVRGVIWSTTNVGPTGDGGTRPTNEVIEDCDLIAIDGGPYGFVTNLTVRRCCFHDSENEITKFFNNVLIKDCIFTRPDGSDCDEIEIYAQGGLLPTNYVLICHNTFTGPSIRGRGTFNAAVNLTNWGSVKGGTIGPDVYVDNNRFWSLRDQNHIICDDGQQGSGYVDYHATNNGFYPVGTVPRRNYQRRYRTTILTNSGNFWMATPTSVSGSPTRGMDGPGSI